MPFVTDISDSSVFAPLAGFFFAKESYEYVTETAAWVKEEISLRDEVYQASLEGEKRSAIETGPAKAGAEDEDGHVKAKLKAKQEATLLEARGVDSSAVEYMKTSTPPPPAPMS